MNTIATSELFWVILAGYVFFVLGAGLPIRFTRIFQKMLLKLYNSKLSNLLHFKLLDFDLKLE